MLEFSNFVYLDLQKTGSAFLRRVLLDICNDDPISNIQHQPLKEQTNKQRIMTIRDPSRYYFSLWRYGLSQRGGVFKTSQDVIPFAYSEDSPNAFWSFLNYALGCISIEIEGFERFNLDIYTTRIVAHLVPPSNVKNFWRSLEGDHSPDNIESTISPYIPDVLIRTESLNSDFHNLFEKGALSFLPLKDKWKERFPIDSKKTNTSSSSGISDDQMATYWNEWYSSRVLEATRLAQFLLQRASDQIA